MKTQSTFAEILTGILSKAEPVRQNEKSKPKAHGETLRIGLDFSTLVQGWKMKPSVSARKIYGEPARPRTKLPPPPLPQPKKRVLRVKRKLTFDQIKAVEVFRHYGEKEIGDESTIDEIKSAYHRLARVFHPDAGARSDEVFKKISFSYKKLISPLL